MELKQLKAFLAVAEEQSFSQAAHITGLSQPSLSRLIKQLEDELGVELIDRYHRPLQLTEAGTFFNQKMQTSLQEMNTIINLTKQFAREHHLLNIGFVPSVLYGLLPEIIAMLKQRRPELEIQLKDISSYQQINALKTGEIDVGFGRFAHEDAAIQQILLRHEKYVVALPKLPIPHPLAQAQAVRLHDLSSDRLILYHQTHLPPTEATLITEPLLHLFAQQGLTPLKTNTVTDLQVALGLVAAGEGITLVPDSLKTMRSEQIAYVPILHENATSPVYLHTLSSLYHPEIDYLLAMTYRVYEEKGITYRKQAFTHAS